LKKKVEKRPDKELLDENRIVSGHNPSSASILNVMRARYYSSIKEKEKGRKGLDTRG